MDRGDWWVTVVGGHKESGTAEQLSTHLVKRYKLPGVGEISMRDIMIMHNMINIISTALYPGNC